ncbi:hypothetical protein HDU98_008201 [Podochytrium sp. JEL0797]|nr:hypothetical protein HDU98_008201 [Podochytrium sp. JEL0797]
MLSSKLSAPKKAPPRARNHTAPAKNHSSSRAKDSANTSSPKNKNKKTTKKKNTTKKPSTLANHTPLLNNNTLSAAESLRCIEEPVLPAAPHNEESRACQESLPNPQIRFPPPSSAPTNSTLPFDAFDVVSDISDLSDVSYGPEDNNVAESATLSKPTQVILNIAHPQPPESTRTNAKRKSPDLEATPLELKYNENIPKHLRLAVDTLFRPLDLGEAGEVCDMKLGDAKENQEDLPAEDFADSLEPLFSDLPLPTDSPTTHLLKQTLCEAKTELESLYALLQSTSSTYFTLRESEIETHAREFDGNQELEDLEARYVEGLQHLTHRYEITRDYAIHGCTVSTCTANADFLSSRSHVRDEISARIYASVAQLEHEYTIGGVPEREFGEFGVLEEVGGDARLEAIVAGRKDRRRVSLQVLRGGTVPAWVKGLMERRRVWRWVDAAGSGRVVKVGRRRVVVPVVGCVGLREGDVEEDLREIGVLVKERGQG